MKRSCNLVRNRVRALTTRLYTLIKKFRVVPLRVCQCYDHILFPLWTYTVIQAGNSRIMWEQLWYLSYFLMSVRKFEIVCILVVLWFDFKGLLKTTVDRFIIKLAHTCEAFTNSGDGRVALIDSWLQNKALTSSLRLSYRKLLLSCGRPRNYIFLSGRKFFSRECLFTCHMLIKWAKMRVPTV